MKVTRSKLTLQTQGYFQVAITNNEKLRKYSLSFSSLRAAVCFKYFQAHVLLILIQDTHKPIKGSEHCSPHTGLTLLCRSLYCT